MYYSCLYHTLGSLPRGYTGYIYIIVGLSALLVPTIRAMREPLYSGTSGRTGSTFFICICSINNFSLPFGGNGNKQLYKMNTFRKNCLSAILLVMATVCHAATIYPYNKNVCTLYVPEGTVDLYKAADQWKDFLNISGIATGIKGVNDDTGRSDVTGYYNSNGCNLNKPVRGLSIIRYANGTVRKVITK